MEYCDLIPRGEREPSLADVCPVGRVSTALHAWWPWAIWRYWGHWGWWTRSRYWPMKEIQLSMAALLREVIFPMRKNHILGYFESFWCSPRSEDNINSFQKKKYIVFLKKKKLSLYFYNKRTIAILVSESKGFCIFSCIKDCDSK